MGCVVRLGERLRSITMNRKILVAYLVQRVSWLSYLEYNLVFHITLILSTIFLLIGLYSTTRSLTLFSFHPLCMIVGTGVLLPEGIVAFKNHFLLDSFSPIMQHTKRTKVS
jgi:hypothetical protein